MNDVIIFIFGVFIFKVRGLNWIILERFLVMIFNFGFFIFLEVCFSVYINLLFFKFSLIFEFVYRLDLFY